MKEDHATVCILIPWIGQSKENKMQRRDLCSMDLESRALSDRLKNRGRIVSKDMEL
jgi:hypothetical protein